MPLGEATVTERSRGAWATTARGRAGCGRRGMRDAGWGMRDAGCGMRDTRAALAVALAAAALLAGRGADDLFVHGGGS